MVKDFVVQGSKQEVKKNAAYCTHGRKLDTQSPVDQCTAEAEVKDLDPAKLKPPTSRQSINDPSKAVLLLWFFRVVCCCVHVLLMLSQTIWSPE